MSEDEIYLKQPEDGKFEITFNYGDMKDITVHNFWNREFSATRLLAAAALFCTSGSFCYELHVRKPGARYRNLESKARWKRRKDDTGRVVLESLEIDVKVDVPEEHLPEFAEVVKEHEEHGCRTTRSLSRGFPVKINIIKT